MDKREIKEKVFQVINEKTKISSNERITEAFDVGRIDSLTFIKMLVVFESEFDIEIPSNMLRLEKWSEIDEIVNNINTLLKEK